MGFSDGKAQNSMENQEIQVGNIPKRLQNKHKSPSTSNYLIQILGSINSKSSTESKEIPGRFPRISCNSTGKNGK